MSDICVDLFLRTQNTFFLLLFTYCYSISKRMFFDNNVIYCLTEECAYCKKSFDAKNISFHEKKCRIKCPECSDIVLYQKWQEHQCQISGAEGTLLN